jgi:LPS export ABC transporter protein LptC
MLAAGLLLPVFALAVGCGRQGSPMSTASPKASPTPKPSPPAITATTSGGNLVLFDAKGDRVATLFAATADFNPRDEENIVTVHGGKATLYDQGQPAATLSADSVTADRKARTITGTGNVVAHSLTEKGSPTVRADKMVWQHDTRVINGSGNVVITAEPDYRLYGDSFKADTRLRRFSVQVGGGAPATGRL